MDAACDILNELLNMGEAMLSNGAEVKRVEDTLMRIGRAYGAVRMDVFVITSSIVVTMVLPDDRVVTQTRRITNSGGTDFGKLEDLNALSRSYCEAPFSVRELEERLKRESELKKDRLKLYLGSLLAAGGLAVFFGGSLLDGLLSGAFGVFICLIQELLSPFSNNKVITSFVCSFITGVMICLICKIIPIVHADKIMIGDIMLLIPGIALTNSVKDVLVGDTISGIMRLIESLLWAGAVACGFISAVWLIGA